MALSSLDDALGRALICPWLSLHERWTALALVSQRWRRLALDSVHGETKLDLTWCTGDHALRHAVKIVTETTASALASSRLRDVRLYGPRVCSQTFVALFHGLGPTRLQRLDLESKHIEDSALLLVAQLPRLTHLSLHCIKLTDTALAVIARSCALLQTVDLSGCSRLTDAGVIALVTQCRALQSLNLFMCHRVSDASLVALATRRGKCLERLTVDRCLKISSLAIRYVLTSQPHLQSLSFANCPKAADSDFMGLEQQLQFAPVLTHVDMSGCGSLGDVGASALIRLVAPTLTCLSLRGLLRLTRATFAAVTVCAQLRSLDLSMCRSLTNSDLARIVVACPQLEALMLQGCVHLDDDGVAAVATHSRRLERLSLEFCYNVTDAGVQLVVSECRRLRELNLKALNQLTIDSFIHLIEAKPKGFDLERINIGACADFDTTVMYAAVIKRRFPRARIEWA
ncbi:hypothetical protein ATCC90586_007063 [Pythium insidiosum]|nr:hypothetical protein ATCC90586_007063 [Pythium insidiosum]